tara:strand:- start:1959 stop:3266 length:1308 start_codon:yes stop_codon:yes gene_type:complete
MSKKNALQIEYLHPCELLDYHRQLHKTNKQIEKTKGMIETCSLVTPIIVDKGNTIIVGWHLAEAARQLGMDSVPVIRVDHLDEKQVRVLRIAYDRIAEEAEWDKAELAAEFAELEILLPDLTVLGFELDEINLVLDIVADSDLDDAMPEVADGPAITKLGDLWTLGEHKLFCGDATIGDSYAALLGDEKAQMCFTDAPYNVRIAGHVCNSGKVKHREFAEASGEMNIEQFTDFLKKPHKHMATYSLDGAIIYSCMDWRHMREIMDAAEYAELTMLNLCCWRKDNAGMGSLYRSQHELVFVFKHGTAKHINNVELGKHGRYRTNVWDYPGVNSFGGGRMDELKLHPTVKPAAMVVDAIKDCSKRGGIILDPFGGSGTTLIAAEKAGRMARLIELDPLYCDVTIRRWQELTGQNAVHAETGEIFNETQTEPGGQNDE